MKKIGNKTMASNRKARYEFFIEDTMEAGLVLTGTEVKSIRQGHLTIQDSFATIEKGEIFLNNLHINPYEQGNIFNVDPKRKRKLLLHKREIRKLFTEVTQKGYTLIPLSIYIKDGLVKVQLATAKGKKLYDKRDDMAKKDATRKIEQQVKERYQ